MEWQGLDFRNVFRWGPCDSVGSKMVGIFTKHSLLMTNAEILGGRLLPVQDLPLYRFAEECCWRWAALSQYSLRRVEPLRDHANHKTFGWMFKSSKTVNIGIRFSFRGRWLANPLTAYNIIDTIAHELAHFQQFNEGPKHARHTHDIRNNILDEGFLVEFEKLRRWLEPQERYA